MSRTEYVRYNTGANVYAKPSPLATSPWSSEVVNATENGTTGEYSIAGIDESTPYVVFVRSGGSPASTDIAIYTIDRYPPLNSTLSGARTVIVTVTLSGSPLQGATVRLTKGAETGISSTNVSGQATFNVNDGTWIVAITAPGASFSGASLVVSADQSVSYSMTASPTSLASDPDKRTVKYTCIGSSGAESGVVVTARCTKAPGVGLAMNGTTITATSDVTGVAAFTNMIIGATYEFSRASGRKISVTIPPGSSPISVESIVG